MGCVPPEWGFSASHGEAEPGNSLGQSPQGLSGIYERPWPRESVRVRALAGPSYCLSPSVSAVIPHGLRWQLPWLSGEQPKRGPDAGCPRAGPEAQPCQQILGLPYGVERVLMSPWPESTDGAEAGDPGGRSRTLEMGRLSNSWPLQVPTVSPRVSLRPPPPRFLSCIK